MAMFGRLRVDSIKREILILNTILCFVTTKKNNVHVFDQVLF